MIIVQPLKRFFVIINDFFHERFTKTKKLAKVFKNPEDTAVVIR